MKTHSVNALSEDFEVDRATMVRALKNVLPDAEVTKGRPTFKTSTAARALEQHRRKKQRRQQRPGPGNGRHAFEV